MEASVVNILRVIAVLVAAIMIGNWFQAEVRKTRINGGAWYKPYFSLPGLIIILIVIVLPVLIWKIKH